MLRATTTGGTKPLMANRAHHIRQLADPDTNEPLRDDAGRVLGIDRDEVEGYLDDLASTLLRFGGMASIVAQRVPTGERIAGEPVMETVGLICVYNTSPPAATREPVAAARNGGSVEEDEDA
jgi:hypothetical protein